MDEKTHLIKYNSQWAKRSSLRMIQENHSCRYLSLPAPGVWIQLKFVVLILTRPMTPNYVPILANLAMPLRRSAWDAER